MMVPLACAVGLGLTGCGRVGFDSVVGAGANDALAAGWRLVQVKSAMSPVGTGSLTVPLDATAGGDLIVVGCHLDASSAVTSLVDDAPAGMSAYTRISASHATNQGQNDSVELWYASAAAAATSIRATTNGTVYTVVAWEFETSRPATVDDAAVLDNQATTTAPMSPTISTARAGELVIAVAIASGTLSELLAGSEFTNDSSANSNGWAHLSAPDAPAGSYKALWSSDAGTYCADAAAFVVAP